MPARRPVCGLAEGGFRAASGSHQGGTTMLARCSYVALVAIGFAGLAGCCCDPWGGCYPCGKNWCGPQCGELFWNEWFSIPPACCDPCDECGCYIGPRLNDGLYSHGNDYHGWCEHRHSRPHYPVAAHAAEPVVAEPADEAEPAAEPTAPSETEPYTLPGPEDALPSAMPPDASTGVRRAHGSRWVSHAAAPSRGRPDGRMHRRPGERPSMFGQFDSRAPSRKLARPPRTRLFSR